MGRPKVSLADKCEKEFPEFVSEVAGLNAEQTEARLSALAKAAEENEEAKDNDEELETAREHASQLAAPYRDAKKAIRLKSRYLFNRLKELGAK